MGDFERDAAALLMLEVRDGATLNDHLRKRRRDQKIVSENSSGCEAGGQQQQEATLVARFAS